MSLRTLTHSGRTWTVWDVRPQAGAPGSSVTPVDPEYVGGWLVFQCEDEKRRFAPLPPGWSELPDRDLGTLLKCSVTVAHS